MSTVSGELKHRDSPRLFLDEVYRSLGYEEGILLDAVKKPENGTREGEEWLETGDWLALAKEVNAEKVFFVNNDPVIVFCEVRDISSDEELRDKKLLETYRRVWCMARPICLFIAFPGELRVYSLNKPPTQTIEMWREMSQLAIVEKVAEVAEKLQDYRREEVESGRLFADDRFGDIDQRADKRLIQDLKTIRQALLDAKLDAHYAHALIGRSIFIRYLEDRQVLTPEYFEQIAIRNHKWKEYLRQPEPKPDLMPGEEKRLYNRVLRDKDFTYALFKQLSEDFNGDMFPNDPNEEKAVDQEQHLERLRKFLLGDPDPQQPTLFFWAYDFKIIPIELISSIYEEFYHVSKKREDTGTHYTPSILAEYILSQILNEKCLDKNPRILDPACGSGIFLVESFRRIVRHYVRKHGYLPSSPELREIIRNQIIGLEINEEAVHVAAFSLYLALLHYQEPADILKTKPLPHLIYQKHQKMDSQHFQVLFHANAFGLTQSEEVELRARVVREKKGRANILRLLEAKKRLDINLHSFDVVVGNPPWSEGEYHVSCEHLPFLDGVPKPFKYSRVPHTLSASGEVLATHVFQAKQILPKEFHPLVDQLKTQSDECFQAIRWAWAYNKHVGDKSYAQLFVYRALSFVKEGGVIGLLLHANILFNQSATSREFRQAWLSSARIQQVMNFVRVRNLFFGNAIAPFIFACFEPRQATTRDNYVVYNTAQRTKAVERLHTVILTKVDRRLIRQSDFENRDYLWKTYAWGNQQDAALLAALSLEDRLQDVLDGIESKPGFGFQKGDESPSQTLQNLRSLRSKNLTWYGPLRDEWFEEQPRGVKRDPNEIIYRGQRLIVVRGVKALHGICVRLEYQDFSFRHTIYGIPLMSLPEWQAKLIVGTIWSSLGRYRLFMTAGKWGLWHDEVGSQDILSIPIRLPNRSNEVVQAITNAVDDIRAWNPHLTKSIWSESIFSRNLQTHIPMDILEHLDNAVFDLFELSESEQDLIRDFAKYKFDLFSNGADAEALKVIEKLPQTLQGTMQNLANAQETQTELERYIDAFLNMWNREIEPDGEFLWRIIRPSNVPIICVIFTIQKKGTRLPTISQSSDDAWRDVLMRLEALSQPVSRNVYVDGIARVVTDTDIFIMKRDEQRLWTRSIAREDAEATLLQAMNLQEAVLGR